ncbi:MAG: hypothetical protein M1816_002329 [Peltula sp. TS41687]|nr:MAG: hypothetical protein M1816_002329 [Peltula sp. TS41687]
MATSQKSPPSSQNEAPNESSEMDDAYAAFLNQANQDAGGGVQSQSQTRSQSQSTFATTKAVDTDVPAALQQLPRTFYTSDTDEPFEAVSLRWSKKKLPDEDEFQALISHSGGQQQQQQQQQQEVSISVSIMDAKAFDPKGHYGAVLDAVAKAAADGGGGRHNRRVYRVGHGGTRVEYYVVALDGTHSRLVGVKARAVES